MVQYIENPGFPLIDPTVKAHFKHVIVQVVRANKFLGFSHFSSLLVVN